MHERMTGWATHKWLHYLGISSWDAYKLPRMQTGRLFTLRGRAAATLQARAKFPRFINLSKALVCYLIVCSYGTVPHQICALLKLGYKSTIAQTNTKHRNLSLAQSILPYSGCSTQCAPLPIYLVYWYLMVFVALRPFLVWRYHILILHPTSYENRFLYGFYIPHFVQGYEKTWDRRLSYIVIFEPKGRGICW